MSRTCAQTFISSSISPTPLAQASSIRHCRHLHSLACRWRLCSDSAVVTLRSRSAYMDKGEYSSVREEHVNRHHLLFGLVIHLRINIGLSIFRHKKSKYSAIITDHLRASQVSHTSHHTQVMAIQPQDPSGIAEPDIGPAKDEGDKKGKGKGRARAVREEKPHSPFIGFAAGLCSGFVITAVLLKRC